jgi:hypothetical protein
MSSEYWDLSIEKHPLTISDWLFNRFANIPKRQVLRALLIT